MGCFVLGICQIPMPPPCVNFFREIFVLVRLPVCVVEHDMTGHAAVKSERLTTRLANMRLLPRMRQHVQRQVAALRERLATRLAFMRLIPRMRPRVHAQVARRWERLAATLKITLKWFLTRMGPRVISQFGGR